MEINKNLPMSNGEKNEKNELSFCCFAAPGCVTLLCNQSRSGIKSKLTTQFFFQAKSSLLLVCYKVKDQQKSKFSSKIVVNQTFSRSMQS